MKTRIVRELGELRSLVARWRKHGDGVAVVPTMGALHAGHLALAGAACESGDRVVVTIFVNPKQFNSPDDLARYPRTEEADAKLLAPLGVEVIYVPETGDVYPPGFATTVSVAAIGSGLEDKYRPGHFDGVATIVAKLLAMTQADRAWFGEKDYQQLMVVRTMARDLNIPVEVIGHPTMRDADGLAMSSRNARLSPQERSVAPALNAALRRAAEAIIAGARPVDAADAARHEIIAAGFRSAEYVEMRTAAALAPMATLDQPARLLAAAWLGKVRLIDNIAVD